MTAAAGQQFSGWTVAARTGQHFSSCSSYYTATSISRARGRQRVLLFLCLILIIYFINLQKFCEDRDSTNKFDLYSK
jgi:hypothetical protein